jgi:predicted N-formylglutamate amidohydrolase
MDPVELTVATSTLRTPTPQHFQMNLIITCEHAGNQVPECYNHLFSDIKDVLQSHRGWDPGAAEIAKFLAAEFNVPLFICETTRLLIEPNRSLDNHQLYSEYSKTLFETDHDLILQQYYLPHRTGVEHLISKLSKPVLHLSIHSFTPVWNGTAREVDVGLLFDPAREHESDFCSALRAKLKDGLPGLNIRMNEPYKGTDDGFTTYLRTRFEDHEYLGIELEVNQKYIGTAQWEVISVGLKEALLKLLPDRN